MAKRKHKPPVNESIEEQVLKKYRDYQKYNNIAGNQSEVTGEGTSEAVVNEDITEKDTIRADSIIKEVKKIKDENTKNAIKLRKKAKKLAKQQTRQQQQEVNQTTGDDKDADTKTSTKSVNALQYLNDWKQRPNDWKFKKSLQIWLLKNWKNSELIGDTDFDLFVEYIFAANSQSLAKTRLQTEAKAVIDAQEVTAKAVADDDNDSNESETNPTAEDIVADRARRVLQCAL